MNFILRILVQSYNKSDLPVYVGQCDLYFVVQYYVLYLEHHLIDENRT